MCACRKGMIVWQDAVAMFWEKPYTEHEGYRSEPEKQQFLLELKRMVEVGCSVLPEPSSSLGTAILFYRMMFRL
jgi:hypothetical protein